jgi:ABC-type sulfate/molybdate transport systems ATPase subunit
MLTASLRVERPGFSLRADLAVAPGDCLCLLGPTGAGKSTLLRAVAGVEEAEGSVRLAGRDLSPLPPWRRRCALVPQRPRPLPGGRVRDQVAFACPGGRLDSRAAALLEDFDLAPLADRPARALSGGETQRLAIVQALASRPAAVLLDEPLAAQDPERRRRLGDRLRERARDVGAPLLWATHDLAEAQRVADRVAVLDGGAVVLDAPVAEMLDRPPSWRVARLLGYEGWVRTEAEAALALHPDRLRLGPPGPGELALKGRVVAVRPHGGGWRAALRLAPEGEAEVTLLGPPPSPGPAAVAAPAGPVLPLPAGRRPW